MCCQDFSGSKLGQITDLQAYLLTGVQSFSEIKPYNHNIYKIYFTLPSVTRIIHAPLHIFDIPEGF